MKTALYLTAWGLMEVFGLNPHNYAGRLPVGVLTSVKVSDLEALCNDIVTDGAARIAANTGRPVLQRTYPGPQHVRVSPAPGADYRPLLEHLNVELKEKLSIIDPRQDFPQLHARKFEAKYNQEFDYISIVFE